MDSFFYKTIMDITQQFQELAKEHPFLLEWQKLQEQLTTTDTSDLISTNLKLRNIVEQQTIQIEELEQKVGKTLRDFSQLKTENEQVTQPTIERLRRQLNETRCELRNAHLDLEQSQPTIERLRRQLSRARWELQREEESTHEYYYVDNRWEPQ